MTPATLYESLSREPTGSASREHGRTERTADKGETIDNDRAAVSLYARIGEEPPAGADHGRTNGTKAGGETVDNDRHVPGTQSALLAGDLYAALGSRGLAGAGERGQTAVTESTESVDRDRSPLGLRI